MQLEKATTKGSPIENNGFFHCFDPLHMLKDFRKEVDFVKAAKGSLEYMERKTEMKQNDHTVSFALCH